jgi:hypothetical protein
MAPAIERHADFDRLRRIRGESDHREADDQAATDAMGPRHVQPFLTVRVAVLNDTLEQAFRSWHTGFRPLESPAASCAGVSPP